MKDKTYNNADSFAISFDEEWQKVNCNDIVQKIKADDADFGHTPMELNLHFPDGSIKWVEDTVARMVSES